MEKSFKNINDMTKEELAFINNGDNVEITVYYDQNTYRNQMIFENDSIDDVIYITNRLVFSEKTIYLIVIKTYTYKELLDIEKEKLEKIIFEDYVEDRPNLTVREYSNLKKELKTSDKLKYEVYSCFNEKHNDIKKENN